MAKEEIASTEQLTSKDGALNLSHYGLWCWRQLPRHNFNFRATLTTIAAAGLLPTAPVGSTGHLYFRQALDYTIAFKLRIFRILTE